MRQQVNTRQPKAPAPMSLRKRIENSEFLENLLAGIAGRYLAFCHRTTQWQVDGLDELQAALKEGPVLLLTWHSRLMLAALHWPITDGQLSSLHDTSPIARVTGAMQRRIGLQPMKMSRKVSNVAASRMVLKRVKEGISIGMTADGPLGPALEVKDAPLEWARVTGMPVFSYAYATTKGRRLDTWDKLLVPKPFGKGAYVFRRYPETVPRKLDPDALEDLRSSLCEHMNATMAEADRLAGQPPGP